MAEISGPAIIDEIQRAPALLLAIKHRLDANQARGQFLLTRIGQRAHASDRGRCSAGARGVHQPVAVLAGELHGRREAFIDRLFAGEGPPRLSGAPVGRGAVAGLIVTGGYPEPQGRRCARSRAFLRQLCRVAHQPRSG